MPMCGRVKAHLLWMVGVCLLLMGAMAPVLAGPPAKDAKIVITKVGSPNPVCIGGTVKYTITITNKGTNALTDIEVYDEQLGGDITDCFFPGQAKLAKNAKVKATIEFYVDYFCVEFDPEEQEYYLENTLTVCGVRGTGRTANEVYNVVEEEVDVVPPLLVTKVPDCPVVEEGGEIDYTIKIKNTTKDITFNDVAVVDYLFADEFPGGDITELFFSEDATLYPGDCVTAELEYCLLEDDPNIEDGAIINTVVVTAVPDIVFDSIVPEEICVEATAIVQIADPEIKITKVPNIGAAGVGKTVSYTISIKNTGNVDLENVKVTDKINGTDKVFNLTSLFFPKGKNCVLPAGECISIQYPYTVQSSDPSPLIDTVTVHANPICLECDVADTAKACVKRCSAGGGSEPGQQFLPDLILYDANYRYAGGDNIYNTTCNNQTLNVTIAKGCKLVLPLRVENDMLAAQYVDVTACVNGKKALWDIAFYNAFNGGAGGGDITGKVFNGWNPAGNGKMDENSGRDFAIGITPTGSSLKCGDKITILVSACIDGKTDTVQINATVK